MDRLLQKFKIGLIQMECSPDPVENIQRAVLFVEKAATDGANIICLPELFRSQYFCQKEDPVLFDLAETIPGPTTEIFCSIAKKTSTVLIVPVFEKRAAGLYHNSAVVIDADGKIKGTYRKMHIPDDPSYFEKFYFTPGDLGFKVFETRYGKIAALICWDQWYPEAARLAALQGANIIFYPTAIGWHPKEKEKNGAAQRDAWTTIQRSHAIANGVYIAAVNRTGFEKMPDTGDGLEFWGSSFIADPQGAVISHASTDKVEILIGEIDLQHLEEIRRNWPYLRDRRIDAYQGITQRYIE
jgi:N-carbamoylputrescine amidase